MSDRGKRNTHHNGWMSGRITDRADHPEEEPVDPNDDQALAGRSTSTILVLSGSLSSNELDDARKTRMTYAYLGCTQLHHCRGARFPLCRSPLKVLRPCGLNSLYSLVVLFLCYLIKARPHRYMRLTRFRYLACVFHVLVFLGRAFGSLSSGVAGGGPRDDGAQRRAVSSLSSFSTLARDRYITRS